MDVEFAMILFGIINVIIQVYAHLSVFLFEDFINKEEGTYRLTAIYTDYNHFISSYLEKKNGETNYQEVLNLIDLKPVVFVPEATVTENNTITKTIMYYDEFYYINVNNDYHIISQTKKGILRTIWYYEMLRAGIVFGMFYLTCIAIL